MAVIPEFISILRDIRDRVFPSVNASEQKVTTAEANVTNIENNVKSIQADITNKNAEIKTISVINPVTAVPNLPNGNAGSANVNYNGGSNTFDFHIPIGPKGDSQRIDHTVALITDLTGLVTNSGDIAFVDENSSQYVKLDTGNNTAVGTDWSQPIIVTPTTEYIALADTPATYAGQSGKIPTVKNSEDGIVFNTGAELGIVGFNYSGNPLFESPISNGDIVTNTAFGSEERGYGYFLSHTGTPTMQTDSVRVTNGVTIANPSANLPLDALVALELQLDTSIVLNSVLLDLGNFSINIDGNGKFSITDGTTTTTMSSLVPVITSKYQIIVTKDDFMIRDITLGGLHSTASLMNNIVPQSGSSVTLGGGGLIARFYAVSVSDRSKYNFVSGAEEIVAQSWYKQGTGEEVLSIPHILGSNKGMYFLGGALGSNQIVRMQVGDGAGFGGNEVTLSFEAYSLGVGSNSVGISFVTDRGAGITTNRFITKSVGTLVLDNNVKKSYSLTFDVDTIADNVFIDADGRDYVEFLLPSNAHYFVEVAEPKLEIGNVQTDFTPQGGSGSGEGTPSIGKENGRMLSLRGTNPEWSPVATMPNVISEDYTLEAGVNGILVNPRIEDGVNIRIEEGSTLRM